MEKLEIVPTIIYRFLEGLKLFWMVWWRFFFLTGIMTGNTPRSPYGFLILFISLTSALFFHKSLYTFPIIRLLRRKSIVKSLRRSELPQRTFYESSTLPENSPNSSRPFQTSQSIEKTTSRGRLSGFEPREMAKVSQRSHPTMFGTPGAGLLSSSTLNQTKARIGAEGERDFYKALEKSNLLDRVYSFWSVAMPSERGLFPDLSLDTDIDCILVSDRHIILVDVKRYISGGGTWRRMPSGEIALYDDLTSQMVGYPRKPTRNMELALKRFRSLFPGYKVTADVVFMPGNSGEASIDQSVRWPGNIPVSNVSSMVTSLSSYLQPNPHIDPAVIQSIRNLLK